VGYGQWQVARPLVERGARVDRLWHAAPLDMMDRLEALIGANPAPSRTEIGDAFWQARHGGQPRRAAYLLARGAAPDGVPAHAKATPLQVATGVETWRQVLADRLRKHGTKPT
jgi:hypothetical protein